MSENLEHCTPEVVIDLTEGAPVDARVWQHVAACDDCAGRVRELRRTLDALGGGEFPEPAASYWHDFRGRLSSRIERESQGARTRPKLWWAVTAAAVVGGFFIARGLITEITPAIGLWRGAPPPRPMGSGLSDYESVTALLPPVDEDPEFQFLVSVAGLLGPNEDWDEVSSGIETTEEYGLTREEETLLLEKLENEQKTNAKS